MHRDEGDVPAADEEAGDQQQEAAMAAGLGDRLAEGLAVAGGAPAAGPARRRRGDHRSEPKARRTSAVCQP